MTTQHYLKRQRRKRKRHSYRRPKRPFFRTTLILRLKGSWPAYV